MSTKSNFTKSQDLHKLPPIRNGLKYDWEIDIAIINEFSISESISSGDLKRKIEKFLGRAVKERKYFAHLKRMVNENLLTRKDSGERGKRAVFYSLTEEAKKRKTLKLLRTDPDYNKFSQIYGNLLFRAIIEPGRYSCIYSGLDQLLSDIHANRKDLVIIRIEKKYCDIKSRIRIIGHRKLAILSETLVIHYEPINNVKITETVTYRKNISSQCIWEENSTYDFSIPGISPKDFSTKYYTYKADLRDSEKAFELLDKSGLIKPTMEFRGEIRYELVDEKLHKLLTDISNLNKAERHFYAAKEEFVSPSEQEIDTRRVFYSDGKLFKEFMQRGELNRQESRFTEKDKKSRITLKKKVNDNTRKFETARATGICLISETYKNTLQEYSFLSDVIEIFCPIVFKDLSSKIL